MCNAQAIAPRMVSAGQAFAIATLATEEWRVKLVRVAPITAQGVDDANLVSVCIKDVSFGELNLLCFSRV